MVSIMHSVKSTDEMWWSKCIYVYIYIVYFLLYKSKAMFINYFSYMHRLFRSWIIIYIQYNGVQNLMGLKPSLQSFSIRIKYCKIISKLWNNRFQKSNIYAILLSKSNKHFIQYENKKIWSCFSIAERLVKRQHTSVL